MVRYCRTGIVLFLTLLLISGATAGVPSSSNPVYYRFNTPVPFDKITKDHVTEATGESIGKARDALKSIYAIPKEKRTFDNTMLALDNMYNDLYNVSSVIYLLANSHANDDLRNECNQSIATFSKFGNEMIADEELYRAVKEFSESAEAKLLTGYKEKFVRESVRAFERNGFALPGEKRAELKTIRDRLSELSIAFSRNIAEHKDSLVVGDADMAGLPDDYKTSRRRGEGRYVIGLESPVYVPFMKYSASESARKDLYVKYNNRASDKNLDVLKEMLIERGRLARLLGYSSFAAYQVEERMAKSPENIWAFENNLIDRLKTKARRDYDELLEVKRSRTATTARVINPWEASYYNNILLKEKYEVDGEKVKEYFELDTVMDGLFTISQNLFGVQFVEVSNPSVWHEDVRMFEVRQDGKTIATFYLDLFPRPNKFTHFACFRIIGGKDTPQGYQQPSAALLCNFPAATGTTPSLLLHSQVETFFHEFGHVLHNVLTRARLYAYSGTSVSRDFVEAPSQIFENWTWSYDALKLFARHYKTGEVLPVSLFERMKAAKNVGSGLAKLQQVFYGILDMTYHDRYDPEGRESTTDVVRRLQNEITLYPYLEGTNFQAAFGHLTGYAAGYYGYLWSEVYAQDMFSIFEENGIMDQRTGARYRDKILARGGAMDELDMVKEFLGREPSQEAFFRSLGLTDEAGGSGGPAGIR